MKASQVIAFFLFISLFGIHSVTIAQNENLLGIWEYRAGGVVSQLQFLNENTLVFNGENSQYTLTDNAVRVYDEFDFYFDYLYVFQEGSLLLTFPDGIQYPFQRVDKTPQANQQSPDQGSIVQSLYGKVCSYSSSSGGGSSYSSSRTFYFDGKGRFTYSTEGSYSGNGDGYYGNDPNAITGSYSIEGNTITFNMDSGGSQSAEIKMIQTSGEITEFQVGSTFYGKGICY